MRFFVASCQILYMCWCSKIYKCISFGSQIDFTVEITHTHTHLYLWWSIYFDVIICSNWYSINFLVDYFMFQRQLIAFRMSLPLGQWVSLFSWCRKYKKFGHEITRTSYFLHRFKSFHWCLNVSALIPIYNKYILSNLHFPVPS